MSSEDLWIELFAMLERCEELLDASFSSIDSSNGTKRSYRKIKGAFRACCVDACISAEARDSIGSAQDSNPASKPQVAPYLRACHPPYWRRAAEHYSAPSLSRNLS